MFAKKKTFCKEKNMRINFDDLLQMKKELRET